MRAQELWRTHCQQLSEYDAIISVKDAELDRLRARTEAEELDSHPPSSSDVVAHTTPIGSEPRPHVAPARRGKAPPVDSFRGEDYTLKTGFPPSKEQPHGTSGQRKSSSCS